MVDTSASATQSVIETYQHYSGELERKESEKNCEMILVNRNIVQEAISVLDYASFLAGSKKDALMFINLRRALWREVAIASKNKS